MKEVPNPFNFTLSETGKIVGDLQFQKKERSQFDELLIWLYELVINNQKFCTCIHYQLDHHSPGGGWAGYGDVCQVTGCGCQNFEELIIQV